jgi:BlaI family transcriptional regulator, penicillinase repressor
MKRPNPQLPRPTQGELEILHVLWEHGSCSVREVHEVLASDRAPGYTTVLKLLQIMTEKGLVTRDDRQRTHLYVARLTREQTQRQMVDDLLERAFGGSASRLVLQALAARKASAEEIAEIRDLLDRLEGGAR